MLRFVTKCLILFFLFLCTGYVAFKMYDASLRKKKKIPSNLKFRCCLRNWPLVQPIKMPQQQKEPSVSSFGACGSSSGRRCIGASLERRSWREARTGRIRPCRPRSGAPRPWPHSPCLYNMWWGDRNTHKHKYMSWMLLEQSHNLRICHNTNIKLLIDCWNIKWDGLKIKWKGQKRQPHAAKKN